MGQPIAVTTKRGVNQDMVRFELNRSLTGMGHERYRAGDEILGHRPVDEVARRLLATGKAEAVHCYASVVTVDLAPGADADGLADIIANLHVFYGEGAAEDEAAAETSAGTDTGETGAQAEASEPA